jgi:hypothetical protein
MKPMSSDIELRHTQPHDAATVSSAVEAYFARVAASGRQPRLKGVTGICQIDVPPLGSWCLRVKDGVVHVTHGPAGSQPPTCVVTCDAASFLDFASKAGHRNIMTGVLQEEIIVAGDLPFAYALLGSFTFPIDGGHAAAERSAQ